MKSSVSITVTGSAHGTAPPTLRTWLLHSDFKHKCRLIKAALIYIFVLTIKQCEGGYTYQLLKISVALQTKINSFTIRGENYLL